MGTFLRSLRARSFAILIVVLLLALTACGGGSGSSGGSSSNPNSGITLTVGGKLDTEAQLLTKMYVLLLRHAGFNVVERAALGTNQIVFNAITSGQIDLYPEFTATGLAKLGQSTTHNAQQDYQLVKQGYEQQYQITWLDPAPMNDTYGVCTTKDNATRFNVSKVSDLVPLASKDTLATPPDGQSDPNVIPALQKVYGIKF